MPHFFFCGFLDLVKVVLKRQLDMDAHSAFRICMGIQMEKWFSPSTALYTSRSVIADGSLVSAGLGWPFTLERSPDFRRADIICRT